MNEIDPRDDRRGLEDTAVLSELNRLVDELDPPPADLVDRVKFAIALESLDVEVARWERAGSFAGVRGGQTGTITFTVDNLTLMVNFTSTGSRHRIDGWLVPAGEHTVEVRVADHQSSCTQADDGGRFVLSDVPTGTTQILVHLVNSRGEPGRTVVTPTIML
ncbi:carboxypeptidase regulatory-like domain-containing protein [Lentzea sp. BCCO 10_0856]|uniref:Carboxypeptidase regulatory-like domain-containing protein n=1 Tax=Lentzea miocenica TaxID=3095431 RepID=A0ABU4TEC0_9PSEU|nr:carboxypeptidase regulatory-like domain-containing protein [Lentzea sp. BCCO 10_0856]MDX8036540.1 carboxypeptidase regulatory-like domain-containing protein [Lentzea sp. BCCO 10_0856]